VDGALWVIYGINPLIVGLHAMHNPGRRTMEKEKTVNILGMPHTRRAEVVTLNEPSAHADRTYVKTFMGKGIQSLHTR
jgi:hypothetical protein